MHIHCGKLGNTNKIKKIKLPTIPPLLITIVNIRYISLHNFLLPILLIKKHLKLLYGFIISL